ncbi:MAG: Na(+)-translocating NADH-quinone reductase subunit C [Planctomycetia bacterium]|nr:Na(+)-translocating NADH-quinone reductase subunit C [Planctomycetia bacterium]
MSDKKDSIFRTFLVAFLTCAICSVFVSAAAVALRPIQQKNQELFKNKNILLACGLLEAGERLSATEVDKRLESVRVLQIDFATGKVVAEGAEAMKYDERQAAKTPGENAEIAGTTYPVGLPTRGKCGLLYVSLDPETKQVSRIVIPIVGKGLWSIMSGFLALDADVNTIGCLLFYEHGETAGLGGEIENKNWQARWVGKKAFDGSHPAVHIIKGAASADDPYAVDGISGATLTCNGVNATVGYWLSQYQPFLKKFAEEGGNVQ